MTPKRIIRPLIALALCILVLPIAANSNPARAQDPPLVLAFYYAWYDQNTWASGLTVDQPTQPYTSGDPATIERHVSQAQTAGIDALIQSWYGPQETDNQTETNFRTLLDVGAVRSFHAAVDFETTGPFFPNQASVTDALRYLLSTHAQHPAYLRYEGKPVIFFWRQGRFSVDEWAAIRSQVDPEHNSLWIAEGVDIDYQAVFDGHHLYSIAWSPDVERTLSDWGVRVRRYATQKGVERLWVATVMPGYDDTRTDRADAFAVNRGDGDYYRETWTAATATQPDWVVITSFNEWVEGTMIEPSLTYGDLYLNLTRELATVFKSERGAPQGGVQDSGISDQGLGIGGQVSRVESSLQTEPYIRADEAVRVRSGPGTEYARIGRLSPGETARVIGKNADTSWWQIEYEAAEDGLGWVTAEFVTFVGDPEAVPVVEQVAPTPSRVSSPTSTSTARPSPTYTPGATPTSAPTPSPRPPTKTPTSTSTPTSTPSPTHASTSTLTPVRSPTLSPTPTSTPMIRTTPSVQRRPVALLWTGIVALILALGLGVVLLRIIRARR